MAFKPSNNLLDKDTHNMLVEALKTGGIGYTEADGTVHKISDTYGGGGTGGRFEVVFSEHYDAEEDDSYYIPDKTYEEALAAYNAGCVVVFSTNIPTSGWASSVASYSDDDSFFSATAFVIRNDSPSRMLSVFMYLENGGGGAALTEANFAS